MNPIQTKAKAAGVNLDRLPVHIGMIMDGNGRFAKAQGFARLWGHHKGYKTLRTALLDCSDLGIRYLTVYAFSSENWRRSDDEVAGLMQLIEKSTRDEVPTMMRNNVRLKVAGRLKELPASLQEAFQFAVETTAANTGITFTLAVNYGGRAEIVDAVRDLIKSGVPADEVDEACLSRKMYLPEVPDPDMILRTAGEMRWSNFLIYQAAYAELVVTDTTWPEFKQEDLFAGVIEYQSRLRKFGGVTG
ncbi:MAG: di-trans,poly-cis-decaprenylcistransferase [Chthonomonas sp.]|nr:di-trans,poly-cis-decaprenylcistransferase [Chthonomonas sp.]